ncbi:MAG: hypothetical protein HFH59_06955 [Lachnospiraceae bacterium]|nr:hypothetical protein [Lachnospiraceae bacterium]
MANFNAAALTKKGISLLAKTQAGQTGIEFTKAVSGSGSYTADEPLIDKESLKDQKQEFPIDKLSVLNDTTVSIRFSITNQQESGSLTEGYYVKEVGLFAVDPDEGEVLYAIATAVEDQWDYMPAYNSLMPAYITVEFYAEVSNAANVVIKCSGRFVTAEELEEELDALRKEAAAAHKEIKDIIAGLGGVPGGVLTSADKGVANGVASLDSTGRLAYGQIPKDAAALFVTKLAPKNFTWTASADDMGWIGNGTDPNSYPSNMEPVKTAGTGRWIEMLVMPDVSQLYSSYAESFADKIMHLYRKSNFKGYCRFDDGKCYFKVFADSNLGSSDAKILGLHLYVLRTGTPSY